MTEHECQMIADASALFRTMMLVFIFMGAWNKLIEREHARRKVLLFVGIVLYLLLLDVIEAPIYIKYIPIFIITIIYCIVYKVCKWEKPVFLLLLLYNLHTMAFLIANSFQQLFIKKMDTMIDMNATDTIEKIYLHTGIAQITLMAVYALVLAGLYRIFVRISLKSEELSFFEFAFLSVLNVVGIVFAYMIVELTVVPLENEAFILYDEATDFLWKIPLVAILLLIGEYSSIFVFSKYKQILLERESVIAREQQLKQLQYRFEEAQLLYGNLKSLRHDMKNHMQTIEGLVAAGEGGKATEYIDKLNDAIEGIDCKYSTGNALCDVVLNDKYRQAKKDQIDMKVSFWFIKGISDFDMGIILSNLCDNAIEACRRLPSSKRKIMITLIENGPCVLLTVTNPFDGEIQYEKGERFPATCKYHGLKENVIDEVNLNVKGTDHGVGLHNVAVIADAYLGSLQIDTANHMFSAIVMLQKKNE